MAMPTEREPDDQRCLAERHQPDPEYLAAQQLDRADGCQEHLDDAA